MRNKKNFRFLTIALTFTMLASTCCFPLTTDVVVAKEATQMGGIRGADDDTSANQTFDDSKIEGADSNALSNLLKELPEKVENNSKVNNNMNDLGDKSGVESGKIMEITEFGGWTAIDGGKFAIAKKTQYGFFPIGLINVTRAGGKEGGAETAFVQESVLDKTNDYTLLLGKAVTGANRTEPAYNDTPYKHTGEWKEIARNVKGFKGIEKTFKAYSPATGSNVKVGFKIGYTGDIDGKKAKYKVEVLAHTETGEWKNIYTKEFYPTDNDAEVKAAKDGNVSAFNVTGMTKDQAEEKMNFFNIVPNGTVGTFTSNDIQLPKGATEYKVKISIADQDRLGMSYQSKFELYALPISGADFNIAQDTKQLAKYLFTQIYNKLLDEKAEDIKNMTPESIKAYEEALNAMKDLSEAKDVKSNQDYINALTNVEGKKEALKLMVNPPQNPIEVANPAQLTAEEKGKVREAIKAANKSLNLTDNDIEVKEDGSVVVTKDNKTANVPANKAVTKKLMVNPPQQAVEVENPEKLSDTEKQAVKDAIKAANQALNLTDNEIEVNDDGSVVVTTKDGKTANVPANQAVKPMVNPPQNPVEVVNPAQLTAEEKGKVREAIKAANPTLQLEDADIDIKENGEVVVTKDGKTANVPANKAVTKKLMVNPPQQAVEVENPEKLSETEKQAVKDAIKAANKSLNLTDNDIEVKEDGSVVVTKDNKTANVPANQAVVQKGATPSDNNNIHNDGYDYYPWFNLVYGGFDFSNTNTSSITNSAPKKDTLEYVFTIDKKYYEVVKNGVSTMHDMDVAPVIKNNRTMLPLRYVAEAIGAEVKWDAMTRTATFIKGSITTKIQIDTDEILLSNGTTIHMDSKPLVVNGRILIPVVNVANVFGLTNGNTKDSLDKDIEWNSENRTATIYMER